MPRQAVFGSSHMSARMHKLRAVQAQTILDNHKKEEFHPSDYVRTLSYARNGKGVSLRRTVLVNPKLRMKRSQRGV